MSSNACNDLGPNIVGQILPDNIRLPVGESIGWDCFATGESPQYQWKKDYVVTILRTEDYPLVLYPKSKRLPLIYLVFSTYPLL